MSNQPDAAVKDSDKDPEIEGADPARPRVHDLEIGHGHGSGENERHHHPPQTRPAPLQQHPGHVHLPEAQRAAVKERHHAALAQEVIQGLHEQADDDGA